MKKLLLSAAVAITAISAQAQDLPKPSPLGEVEQVVGVTEIEIEYSRPGVKDRAIFGDLVAFDELWRFGANSATTLDTEHDLHFSEGVLSAGEYAVLAVPGKESWEIVFNKDTKTSASSYNDEMEVLRVKTLPQKASFTETLTIGIDEIRNSSASLVMLWENTKISVPFKVMTDELAVKNIKEAVAKGENLAEVYQKAANYYYGSVKDYETALQYANKAVDLKESYGSLFMKARILKESGDDKGAMSLAKKSLELAKENASQGYINFISGTISSWEK